MHLPKHCNECNEDFCIPLDDSLKDVRKHCLLCCQPSHACPKNLIDYANELNFPLWLCSECMENRLSPHIKFLEDLPPPIISPQHPPTNSPLSTSPPHSHTPPPSHTPPLSHKPPLSHTPSLSSSPLPSPQPSPSPQTQKQDQILQLSPDLIQVMTDTPHTSPEYAKTLFDLAASALLGEHLPSLPEDVNPTSQTIPINTNITPPPITKSPSTSLQSTFPRNKPLPHSTPSITNHPKSHIPPKSYHKPNKIRQKRFSGSICLNLKNGNCQFGMSGEKNGKCPHPHPNFCIPYLKHGLTMPNGCQKGSTCHLWHATYICINSARTNKCLTPNCKFFHHSKCIRPAIGTTNQPQNTHTNLRNHFFRSSKWPLQIHQRFIPPLMSINTNPLRYTRNGNRFLNQNSLSHLDTPKFTPVQIHHPRTPHPIHPKDLEYMIHHMILKQLNSPTLH